VPFGLDDFIGLLPAKTCTLQDYGINHARRVYRSNRLTELRAARAGGEGATRPCQIRYDPHNPLFVWVEHDGEFVPFRAAPDMLDEPMGGDVWREARAAEVDRDPMHLTSITKSAARDEVSEEPGDDEVIWERGGGFSLLTDDDGVWERLT